VKVAKVLRIGVLQFPGSCDELDTCQAVDRVATAELLWHKDRDLKGAEAIVVPGGFSYGDYLRAGAIARFSPIMEAVSEFAAAGGPVLGICNGFQVLCEAGLLPGALLPNNSLKFICQQADLELINAETPFTGLLNKGQTISIPAKHQSGRYYAPPELLESIENNGQVVVRYCVGDRLNGSLNGIAGVCNAEGNVVGMMPHPEHAVDKAFGSDDGLSLFKSVVDAVSRSPKTVV